MDTQAPGCHKRSMNRSGSLLHALALVVLGGLFPHSLDAQSPAATPKQGAALLKTDIMGVFAHPDDETGMAATLACYALGQTSVVANIYCTRGEGGGNMVGTQWGATLGTLREAELRDCLSTLGIRYCYFLDQLDWAYTESAAATLRKWGHEQTLERLVRLVRALQPEVIVTMNPAPTPGQHGHHQAAGVLATEAFTAAADPKRFPLQLTREGLTLWQPRKLFFGGGSSNQVVATIAVNEPLPGGKTPAQIAAQALANHRSQAFGNFGNSPWLQRPQRFTLVKTFVPIAGTGTNLLAGLPANELSARPIAFTKLPPTDALTLRFISRPAFVNYQRWVSEQGIEHVAAQFRADLPLVAGEANSVRLQLGNAGSAAFEGELTFTAPDGWRLEPARQRVKASGHATRNFDLRITPPAGSLVDAELGGVFSTDGLRTEAIAKGHPVPRTRVIRLRSHPALDGTDAGWERVSALTIAPTNLVQGKVADAADSSASFRLAHDGKTLFVDVQVKDDAVITNIAPNDIRGHWRSDSVEICLDPVGGAEDTMGCYKIGIFPFDMTGVVRAARDADANQGLIEETAPKTRLISRRTADGYRIQAAIPFDEIGLKRGQKRLGFNVIIYDGDKREAVLGENINKSRIAWAPRSGVQGRPEDWGRVDLE
jgi:LmbE family N-acetylglucosaminyl deacetylase